MTKWLLPICVCLGGLLLPAGCTGTPSGAPKPQSQQEIITPAESRETQPKQQRGVSEPDEVATTTGGIVKAEGLGDGGRANHRQAALDTATRPEENPRIGDFVNKAPATKQETVEPKETVAPKPQERAEPNVAPPAEPAPPAAVESRSVKPEATNHPQSTFRNPKSISSFLDGYTKLLQSYVQEDGSVDYANLHRQRLEVKRVLMELSELDPNGCAAWSNDEKLAFWINAYNLKTLEIITRNYPIQSSWWLRLTWPPSDIRHIPGIWTDYKFIVMGEEFTLAEVERRFFHRTFNEPRAFLAISYACRSGPPLRRTPYEGEHLARQLDEQVKAFLSSGQGLQIDRRAMVVRLSAIFKPAWRGKEFLARYGTDKKFKDRDPETRAVLSFLTGYLSREDAYFLETENYTIEYTNFDWRLNDTSRGY